jgi:hypothetical protein
MLTSACMRGNRYTCIYFIVICTLMVRFRRPIWNLESGQDLISDGKYGEIEWGRHGSI